MFKVIGERINTSRKAVGKAVAERNAEAIRQEVKSQVEAGADVIDVNAGARFGHEMADMEWLIEVIQGTVDIQLCIDSPDPKVLEKGYEMAKKPPMINSISLEKNRYDAVLEILHGKTCDVIALCMDDEGMPKSTSQIVDRGRRLLDGLERIGIVREHVYVDPMVQPMSTENTNGVMVLDALRAMKKDLPGVKTTCGLSNISYGLPARKYVNRHFASLMIGAGLDCAVADPMDQGLMAGIRISEMLTGKDAYCMEFLKAYRAGRISD